MTSPFPESRVQVLLGAGGVGKTTMTAALGLQAARAGERVAILTIDPAQRLGSALGLATGALGNEPRLVDRSGAGQLWAAMLDTAAMFDAVITRSVPDPEQRRRILGNPLFRSLTTSLSGTHEYMAVEALFELANDDRFDRVFIDTPPARHAIDFLDSPHRLVRFLDHPLYRVVLTPRQRSRRLTSLLAHRAVGVISSVVGGGIVGDIVELFDAFAGLDEGFRTRADKVGRLLASDQTSFIIVTTGRVEACDQAAWLAEGLRRRSLATAGLVVNRLMPIRLDTARGGDETARSGDETARSGQESTQQRSGDVDPLVRNLADLVAAFDGERAAVDRVVEQVSPGLIIEVDDRAGAPTSIEDLASLAGSARARAHARSGDQSPG